MELDKETTNDKKIITDNGSGMDIKGENEQLVSQNTVKQLAEESKNLNNVLNRFEEIIVSKEFSIHSCGPENNPDEKPFVNLKDNSSFEQQQYTKENLEVKDQQSNVFEGSGRAPALTRHDDDQTISDKGSEINKKEEKEQNASESTLMELDEETIIVNNDPNDVGEANCAFNENQNTERILYDAVKDFSSANSDRDGSFTLNTNSSNPDGTKKKTRIFDEKKNSHDYSNADLNHHIKTFEDALKYFGLYSRLLQLEGSLEEVKKHQKTKQDHEKLSNKINKEMQKLSLRYHPDKVISRGGTEEEIATAEKLQAILNASRTVLNILGKTFLEEIYIDHKYAFYSKLHMSSLGNENEIKNRISEVLFEISMASEIKHRYIISEIRKFLIDSQQCIQYFFKQDINSFKKHRNLAFFHLKCCIKGYEKLCVELDEVEKECQLDNVNVVIRQMGTDCKRELILLKTLEKTAEISKKNYTFFSPWEPMDPYFVLPFVSYVNVILMCNVMRKKISFWGRLTNSLFQSEPKYNDVFSSYLMRAHYLVSYYRDNRHKELAEEIMKESGVSTKQLKEDRISTDAIQDTFLFLLLKMYEDMEINFKFDNYVEGSNKNVLKKELQSCLSLMYEFKERKQELVQDIESFKKKTQTMEANLEKCSGLLQKVEVMNRKVEERLQMNEKFLRSSQISNEQYIHSTL